MPSRIVYENRTTFGRYRGPQGPGPAFADDPVRPEGDDWYQMGSTIATIDGLLIWTWQRSRTEETDAPPEPAPRKQPPIKAPRSHPGV